MKTRTHILLTIITTALFLGAVYLLTHGNCMSGNKERESIIKAYFHGLETASYEQVIKLFDKNAIVHSPLYGDVKAETFYRDLFAVTTSSKITLKNILLSANNPQVAAAHFQYDWVLKDGTPAPFECIDVFQFSTDNKIVDLKIIYDSHNTRRAFENNK